MDLLSEEEQWERLKAWLRGNGPAVLILVALFLIAWFGWRWWLARGDQQSVAAGTVYEQVLGSFDANKQAEALAQIETLRREYPKSPYVAAADLIAARVFVARNELDKAVERLDRVAKGAPDKSLRPIALLRLARVQVAQGQYDAALATLAKEMGPHEAARLEVRGDVLLAKGDAAGARKEYEAARKLLGTDAQAGGVAELLDLKIADLGATAEITAAPPGATTAPEATP